jgi:hypothetical protein
MTIDRLDSAHHQDLHRDQRGEELDRRKYAAFSFTVVMLAARFSSFSASNCSMCRGS